MSEIEYTCNNCGHEGLNTRAVPSADTLAGLVRYHIEWCHSTKDEVYEDTDGKYVRYSEAAAVVAAKDAEIERLKSMIEMSNECFDCGEQLISICKHCDKAELAKIKAQVPLLYTDETSLKLLSGHWPSVRIIGADKEPTETSKRALYASPAPDEDLKAENEKLRMALSKSLLTMNRYKNMGYGDEVYMADLCESVSFASSALAGDSNA